MEIENNDRLLAQRHIFPKISHQEIMMFLGLNYVCICIFSKSKVNVMIHKSCILFQQRTILLG